MSTFTTAKNLEQVARGGDLGTWDTPENSNWGIVDASLGQVATISLNNSNVALSTPQYQCNHIIFNSTLTGSVTITFPTTFTGAYSIQNLCTGSSAFIITMTTTAASSGFNICAPPGEIVDIFNDGTNLKYRNLGRVGSYWDYAGSSVPAWVAGCTVPPYLNCDGTTFAAATYPALATILGSTTLPDSKGRARFALGQGSGRLTSSQGGLDGTTIFAGGGQQAVTLFTSNLPAYTPVGTITNGAISMPNISFVIANAGADCPGGGSVGGAVTPNFSQGTSTFTGNAQGGTSFPSENVPPGFISGLMMIRAG